LRKRDARTPRRRRGRAFDCEAAIGPLEWNQARERLSTSPSMNLPLPSLRTMPAGIVGGMHSGDVGIAAAH